MTESQPPPKPLFSEKVGDDLRKALATITDATPEVEGILGIVVYHPRLGDSVEPSLVLVGPGSDPMFLTRAVCKAGHFQQRIIMQLENAMAQGLASLQALRQEIDGKEENTEETASKAEDQAAATGTADAAGTG